MEKIYIKEIREEEYSMENNEMTGGKPQVENIPGGKNEKIPFREIRKDEYMLDEKFYIREMNEEGYLEKNKLEKKTMIYIWKMIFLKLISIYF